MVYCVGLTGDIASGKSTAAELFSRLGVEVIHADKISRSVIKKNSPAYNQIVAHFGSDILDENGSINRKHLRNVIFSNPVDRKWLERLLHPLIRTEIEHRVNSSTSVYCMLEIPLLITKKNYPYIDKIVLVRASPEVLISRVMQRDQCTKEEAEAILSAQPDITLRLEHTDDIITNNLGLEELTDQVNRLHQKYLECSKNQ